MNEITCNALDAFLDHDLESAQHEAFQSHVAICSHCATAIEQQSAMDNSLRSYAQTINPPLREPKIELPETRWTSQHKRVMAIAEACVVIMIGSAIWFALGRVSDKTNALQADIERVASPQDSVPQADEKTENTESSNPIDRLREKQLFLAMKHSEMHQELQRRKIKLTQIESFAKRTKDSAITSDAIEKLIGKDFQRYFRASKLAKLTIETQKQISALMAERNRAAAERGEEHPTVVDADRWIEFAKKEFHRQEGGGYQGAALAIAKTATITSIEIDKQLLPLVIQRNKTVNEYGKNHPIVKALDAEIAIMKDELERLFKKQTERTLALAKESNRNDETGNSLIALLIERDRQSSKLGTDHPIVKCLDLLVDGSRMHIEKQMRNLSSAESVIAQLLREQKEYVDEHGPDDDVSKKIAAELEQMKRSPGRDSKEVTREMIDAIIDTKRAEVKMLETQVSEVELQIEELKKSLKEKAQPIVPAES
ncbi:MAG: zf-HC2 domain-containing protein [Rubripirellula sp.]